MKQALLILAILCLFSLVFADIGPSPSFSFEISNADEYPEHYFYYAGNVWEDKLELVSSNTSVYKLNTHITIYAVPDDFPNAGDMTLNVTDKSDFIASQQIDLKSGHTVFEVASMNIAGQTMQLTEKTNTPDTPAPDLLSTILLGIVGFFVVIIIIVAVLVLAMRKPVKKQKV